MVDALKECCPECNHAIPYARPEGNRPWHAPDCPKKGEL